MMAKNVTPQPMPTTGMPWRDRPNYTDFTEMKPPVLGNMNINPGKPPSDSGRPDAPDTGPYFPQQPARRVK
jgi:hypothetical protein